MQNDQSFEAIIYLSAAGAKRGAPGRCKISQCQ